jgi:aldehyde dehydrogenase family 9 protein A1
MKTELFQGERETGEALCLHPDVNKVSFTGSVPTGQAIMKMCAARNIKPVTLELGGKSALIVFDDADVDNAVVGAMLANYLTQGEVCTNATRVFVHKSVLSEFTEKLLAEVKKLATKVGDPLLDETRMGATICEDHMNKVLGFIESARQEGATVLFGGERIKPAGSDEVKDGWYLSPCVITDTNDNMRVVREEIFGAVCLIIPFDTEEEAIQRVNNTNFGLAAGLFSRNMRRAYEVAARLNAGTVFVNTYNDVDVAVPFGGVKNSGFGRENGAAALQHYTTIKSVYVDTSDKLCSPF